MINGKEERGSNWVQFVFIHSFIVTTHRPISEVVRLDYYNQLGLKWVPYVILILFVTS